MKTCEALFSPSAEAPFFTDGDLAELSRLGASVCGHDDVLWSDFDALIDTSPIAKNAIAYPARDASSVCLPYSVFDHGDHAVDGRTIRSLVEDFINRCLPGDKRVASLDRNWILSLSTDTFSYELLSVLSPVHINVPICVFSSEKNLLLALIWIYPLHFWRL